MENRQPASTFDFGPALKRLGGDELLLKELAKIFVTDAPPVLDKLEQLIAARDGDQAARMAHALKGMVVTFDDLERGLLMSELVAALRESDWNEVGELFPRCRKIIEELIDQCRLLLAASPSQQ